MSYEPPTQPDLPVEKTLDLREFFKLISTSTTTPTDTPKNVYEQIRIVVAGGNASLYAYDATNNKWRAATLGT